MKKTMSLIVFLCIFIVACAGKNAERMVGQLEKTLSSYQIINLIPFRSYLMPGEVHRYATKPKSIADFSQMQTHPAFKVKLGTMPTQHDLVKISEHIEKAKNSKDDGNEIAKEIEELSKNWGDSNNSILVEIAQFPTLKLTKDDALNFGFSLSDIVDLSFDKSKDVNIFLEANNVFSLSVNSNRICKEFMKSDYTKEGKLKTHDRFVSEKYEREIYELGNIWYHREGLAKIGRKNLAPSNVVYLRIPYGG